MSKNRIRFIFYFWFVTFFGKLLKPFYYLLSLRLRRKSIPPAKGEIFYTSATTLARKIRLKQLSSEEVVSAFVNRCRQVNPITNAIIDERFEQALQDARNVDTFLKNDEMNVKELEEKKPLLGIPITIKEVLKVKGMKHTQCVKKNANNRATSNSLPVQLLLNAGAIPIAVTSTPPKSLWWETNNRITGYTPNPYDLTRSSGGSSGGEAALLCCAASVVGLATDSGGSISIPAAFTGLYGHKPSSDIIPYLESLPKFSSNEESFLKFTVGPLCRYVEDIELLLKVLSDRNYGVESSQVDVRNLKIYYVTEIDPTYLPVDRTIKEKILAALTYLREKRNCDVKEFQVPELKQISYMYLTGTTALLKKFLPRNWLTNALYSQLVEPTADEYKKCLFMRSKLKNRIQEQLSNNGVLLLPCYTGLPFYRRESYFQYFGCHYSAVASLCNLAATIIPAGLIHNKMPTGIQIIAAQGQDRLCIAVAKELSKFFGGWIPPFPLDSSTLEL